MYDDFIIHLESLKSGEHSFKFLLDKTFFESIEYSIITTGKVEVNLNLLKKERLCELLFDFNGFINLDCDRCADAFSFPVSFKNETILKYGSEAFIDEGIWTVENSTKELDVKHFLYETLSLAISSKVTHEDADENCDPVVIEKLNSYSKAYSDDNNESESTDPRWDALNKLK